MSTHKDGSMWPHLKYNSTSNLRVHLRFRNDVSDRRSIQIETLISRSMMEWATTARVVVLGLGAKEKAVIIPQAKKPARILHMRHMDTRDR
jgi:hypothetical protein